MRRVVGIPRTSLRSTACFPPAATSTPESGVGWSGLGVRQWPIPATAFHPGWADSSCSTVPLQGPQRLVKPVPGVAGTYSTSPSPGRFARGASEWKPWGWRPRVYNREGASGKNDGHAVDLEFPGAFAGPRRRAVARDKRRRPHAL